MEDEYRVLDPDSQRRRKPERLENSDLQNRVYTQQDDAARADPLKYIRQAEDDENLYHCAIAQIICLDGLPKPLAKAAAFLVERLNSNGWPENDPHALTAAGVTPALMDWALPLVRRRFRRPVIASVD